ncbi:glycosyltransferase family 2 protein [Clostridium thermarum]|uniref:glycosyltransferase family 2 protein n=1 Tax=Clostridium thermarum TaxID=1716543 RepID=UPI0013D216B8|nr:glycosyltransferase family 2 protein [Clostridium thermarum]
MNRLPLVYIIILNYNAYQETLRCLESVNKIDYGNYKVVIVDNNSRDNSAEILKRKAIGHTVIKYDNNLGYAAGNNVGIHYAMKKGADYICILNNDVEVEKDFLNKLITYMESDKKVAVAGPCICDFDERDKVQSMGANINLFTGLAQSKKKNYPYSKLSGGPVEVDYLGGACFIIRRDVFENIGNIPEMYFLFFEETEFCLRAKRAGYKLMCLKDSKIYHKRSATISKYKGLSYYFLNRNRVIFMRRNANVFQKAVFSVYLFIEALGRVILKREPFSLFKIYLDGMKADKNSIAMDRVKQYLGEV